MNGLKTEAQGRFHLFYLQQAHTHTYRCFTYRTHFCTTITVFECLFSHLLHTCSPPLTLPPTRKQPQLMKNPTTPQRHTGKGDNGRLHQLSICYTHTLVSGIHIKVIPFFASYPNLCYYKLFSCPISILNLTPI